MKALLGLAILSLWIGGILGWVLNIVSIFHIIAADGPVNTMFIARCVGVFMAPLGAVLGYM